ncbi:MAG: Co2+/Mg2+ efflux protein ApaG [Phycisphaerales bacterium]|nr:Co2+/Mg2+ efflux protein ApaG [Phycisphaerales bacterium]
MRGSECVTDGIRVQALPMYMSEESDPEAGTYGFAYEIMIRNETSRHVKLLAHHWIIVDADGNRRDMRGEGVIGRTPGLAPGGEFQYMECCCLATTWGTMEGEFMMEWEDGECIEAKVARFYFTIPEAGGSPDA